MDKDFSTITACGENCANCKEWKESKGCPVAMCAKTYEVKFCGLCCEFPCNLLVSKITWNPECDRATNNLINTILQPKSKMNILSSDIELWDAYSVEGNLIADVVLVRNEHIPEGLHHLVCEILVRHVDGSYLLMQRDFAKRDCPGYFEATAGGSALRGESAVECAIRELKEETGITPLYITQLGMRVYPESNAIFHSFLCLTDCEKTAIQLQKGETIAYKWLKKREFISFINSDKAIDHQKKRLKTYYDKIMKDITISQLTVKDLSLLLTLFEYNDEQEMLCENTKLLKNHSIDIFGLFCDGQIIGELRVKYTDSDARIAIPNKRAYLYAFRVLKDFQGKGLGKYLLSTVLKTLYAKSYSEFTVGVENDNATARYIYDKFGFDEKITTLKEDYQGDEYFFDLLLKQ